MSRVYLDYNATAPLRPEARTAMIAAMDVVGNPSSVHAEGRAAKSVVENARADVAALVGCLPNQVIFTGSATEAAALAVAQKHRHGGVFASLPTEHDCFYDWTEAELPAVYGRDGRFCATGAVALCDWVLEQTGRDWQASRPSVALVAMSAANSETGVMFERGQVVPNAPINASNAGTVPYSVICDLSQVAGKAPVLHLDEKRPSYAILSAHKLGGPKGVGALINFTADDPTPILKGGGQEMGRRSGTENIIGIAGFGAAARAAQRDLDAGIWSETEKLRNILENVIADSAKETIFVGKDAHRLPNTSCIVTPGWKGETQVMQMDLAGFAISAGSACSSGKVKASRVLRAMGFDDVESSSAIRVSLGPMTTEEDIVRFAEAWLARYEKHRKRG